jgi:hypothetical protein
MSVDHTNIDPSKPYEMPGGKCEADYPGESYKKILEDNAPVLDMGQAPIISNKKDKKDY